MRLLDAQVEPWEVELASGEAVVCPATAAELGCLVRIGRLRLDAPPDVWFERALSRASLTLSPMSAGMLARAQVFEWVHRDPFDRTIVQTLREDQTLKLYTRDAAILDYCAVHRLAVRDCR